MSYNAEETSVESGRPIELYEIRLGTETFPYTNAPDEQTLLAKTWEPIPIARSRISLSPEARTQAVEFVLPASNAFVQRYTGSVPASQATLQVYRVHRGDISDPVLFWKGVVKQVGFTDKGLRAKLQVVPIEGALRKTMPRLDYGSQCNHMLFDVRCKAVPASHQFVGTVASISGNEIVVTGLDTAQAPPWATGGEVTFGTADRRAIIEHKATNTLVLMSPFNSDVLGQSVTVLAGCDRNYDTCRTKFNNVVNFGGFPFMPTRNPFEGLV